MGGIEIPQRSSHEPCRAALLLHQTRGLIASLRTDLIPSA
jgi:hypothetical protein